MDCVCEFCGRKYIYSRTKGNTTTKCNSCCVNRRRFLNKLKLIKILGGKCVRCGYDKCYGSLHFHHLDPNKKDFNISGNHCRKFSVLVEECKKCELICANCHGEEHYENQEYKNLWRDSVSIDKDADDVII